MIHFVVKYRRHFYDEQLRRMESLGHELVPFEDVLCQMTDMLKPVFTYGWISDTRLLPMGSQCVG